MAQIGTIQLAGNVNAGPAEVELNTLALRSVVRSNDFTYLGSYSVSPAVTGNSFTSTGTPASYELAGLAITYVDVVALVKKVSVGLVNTIALTTAGALVFSLDRRSPGQSLLTIPAGLLTSVGTKYRSIGADYRAKLAVNTSNTATSNIFGGTTDAVSIAEQVVGVPGLGPPAGPSTFSLFDWTATNFQPLVLTPWTTISVRQTGVTYALTTNTGHYDYNVTFDWDEYAFNPQQPLNW